MYLCDWVGWGANDLGRGATQQGNHNCLRNNEHDDYTILLNMRNISDEQLLLNFD